MDLVRHLNEQTPSHVLEWALETERRTYADYFNDYKLHSRLTYALFLLYVVCNFLAFTYFFENFTKFVALIGTAFLPLITQQFHAAREVRKEMLASRNSIIKLEALIAERAPSKHASQA